MRYGVAVVLWLLFFSLAGCRTAPIHNVVNASLAAAPGTTVTLDEVAKAIWAGGARHGWQMAEVRPGEMTGTLRLRSHVAVVTVTYDTSAFSIVYKDSKNLLHEGDSIHRRYNHWVTILTESIQQEIGRLTASR